MQINAKLFLPQRLQSNADFTAVRDGPGAGCLAGVLEGLMVTVQHKNYGSEQLVHPLQAEEEAKGRHVVSVRGKKWEQICGQSLFNSDVRGF